ncbi:hypothetical protein QAD02_023205 [Eretmocerus hayati]|uniref:Uncharacterized protein n=1 Tax=Eretmocerus hayati TaxID=131215 RepID=A0ACC2PV56_9HYME|nr:hypothetical protein QAD02_023205 [Eretmocerus hayati]
MTQRQISTAEAISLAQSHYEQKFEEWPGYKMSEILIDPSNPYVSRKDIIEHKNILLILEKDWPEVEVEETSHFGDKGDVDIFLIEVARTEEVFTSNPEEANKDEQNPDLAPTAKSAKAHPSPSTPSPNPATETSSEKRNGYHQR